MQFGAEVRRDLNWLVLLVDRDGFPDIIDDNLARIAPIHVFLEFFANLGIDLAIDVIAQNTKKVLAFHDSSSIRLNSALLSVMTHR